MTYYLKCKYSKGMFKDEYNIQFNDLSLSGNFIFTYKDNLMVKILKKVY